MRRWLADVTETNGTIVLAPMRRRLADIAEMNGTVVLALVRIAA